MTGEMTEVDEDKWRYHAHIRDLVDGQLCPYDQYQGPYIRTPDGQELWLIPHYEVCDYGDRHKTGYKVYNKSIDGESEPQPLDIVSLKEANDMLHDMVAEVYPLEKAQRA